MSFDEILKSGASSISVTISDAQIQVFKEFTKMMLDYNQKINLTSIINEDDIISKHYLDSLALFGTGVLGENSKIIDIGCGAGFPSFPLKFICNDMTITMVDSLRKRVDFLNLVREALNLKNVECLHHRAEDLAKNISYREKYDIAVSRAVAGLNVLTEYCLPFVKVGGCFIAMKGPQYEEELFAANNAIRELGGEYVGVHKYTLPFTTIDHTAIIIRKVKNCSTKYPRNSNKIIKSPII